MNIGCEVLSNGHFQFREKFQTNYKLSSKSC